MKVDGIEIEWWEKERFKSRRIEIFSSNSSESVINVPIDDIFCCNSPINDFPIAVWDGMAYCKNCFERYLEPNIKKE